MQEALVANLEQLLLDATSEEIFNKLAVLCSVVGFLGPLGQYLRQVGWAWWNREGET